MSFANTSIIDELQHYLVILNVNSFRLDSLAYAKATSAHVGSSIFLLTGPFHSFFFKNYYTQQSKAE